MKPQADRLNIVMLSLHGLIRFRNPELGRDADTGGQTLYVLELAQALSQHPVVGRVVLLTRRIVDPDVDADYGQPVEEVNERFQIVRLDAGPPGYLPKEQLWDYLDEFADNTAAWLHDLDWRPDLFHSHYGDAGLVGRRLSRQLGVPLVHTGHSLGRVKRRRLLASGVSASDVEQHYHMSRRIDAEEMTLATADLVIASTHQEIEEQYELYDHYQPERMRVVPPGTNLHEFHPPTGDEREQPLFRVMTRHLRDPDKPIILALSRPDRRKNIIALVEAYGMSKELQRLANLVIVAGKRDDIDDLDSGAQEVFHELLVGMDRYELYGRICMPKHHERADVSQFYRIAAASGGVFVNPALTEPFGLTLIEAAASGLPIIATEDGGPRDIMSNCNNGILIDPLEPETITDALLALLTDRGRWEEARSNGLRAVAEHYSWQAHANRYLGEVEEIADHDARLRQLPVRPVSRSMADRALVSDLDLSMIGDQDSLQRLMALLRQHRRTAFIIATGRRLDEALKIMKRHGIHEPDILITSSGSEIFYAPKLTPDSQWARHIDHMWTPHRVRHALQDVPGLKLQPRQYQSRFKVSYYIDPQQISLEEVKTMLHREEQSVYVQMAFGQYLDILPLRASKGLALRYAANLWQLDLDRVLVAGGSGADEDMMRGNTLAVVVANRHHEELSQVGEQDNIYFAQRPHAAGILEAFDHYDFLGGGSSAGPEASARVAGNSATEPDQKGELGETPE